MSEYEQVLLIAVSYKSDPILLQQCYLNDVTKKSSSSHSIPFGIHNPPKITKKKYECKQLSLHCKYYPEIKQFVDEIFYRLVGGRFAVCAKMSQTKSSDCHWLL